MSESPDQIGMVPKRLGLPAACLWALLLATADSQAAPLARPADYASLATLPDFGGVWVPNVLDQFRKANSNRPPWTPKVEAEMAKMDAEERAGRPVLILRDCITHGMPSLMVITHNALEFLFTPGRVTILGESDGNRLRRIYTDGRSHPDDPTLTLYGHSIGHWEGKTLVVDTIGVVPQAYIATSEAVGVPNDGGMHVVERISLTEPDQLADELEITAPKVLTGPWKTTRLFKRLRGEASDIIEGECTEGQFAPAKDQNGHDIFMAIPQNADGSIRAPKP